MRAIMMNNRAEKLLCVAAIAAVSLLGNAAQSAVPGISGGTTAGAAIFNLQANAANISQPDGQTVYSWGYGCSSAPVGFLPAATLQNNAVANCPAMQIPGPTLIVHEGDTVTVNFTNNLPVAAGSSSILFPGFKVTATGTPGVLTTEAAHGATATYTFIADKPGTHSYYSGTQGDLQIEMGLSGAIVVLPTNNATVTCAQDANTVTAENTNGETDFRLAKMAYNLASTCYDREYLFQFSEIDPRIHHDVEQQAGNACAVATGCITVDTEPYFPAYFMINGRSMPDDMDPIYATEYPNQPYNGNPHMHPGDLTLLRIIGQGRWQHPFHEHGNHVRVLARDGNLLLARDPANPTLADPLQRLAGPLMFTTTTTPGQAMDGIFQWTGKGLNWDVFGHGYANDPSQCTPDANGYNSDATALNYYEWCGDHNKPLEAHPFGAVGSGGPVTLPDPTIVANGPWYGGSPYLGGEATTRAIGTTPIPPSGTVANSPTDEAGFAYMWHSHNEREITTNNIFPGGMMMMMLVDPRAFVIDETK